jgi:hypothetical protein
LTSQQLTKFVWEVLEHPPYSPDLSLCDLHLFGELEKCFNCQRFSLDDEM